MEEIPCQPTSHRTLDNTDERTLADALVRLIAEWDQAELDAATGFFEPHVWRYPRP
jgi:hypothetical protein